MFDPGSSRKKVIQQSTDEVCSANVLAWRLDRLQHVQLRDLIAYNEARDCSWRGSGGGGGEGGNSSEEPDEREVST